MAVPDGIGPLPHEAQPAPLAPKIRPTITIRVSPSPPGCLMDSMPPTDITTLLHAHQAGAAAAEGRLVALIYDELHRIAHRLMRGERAGHTWSSTDLVHESLQKLLGSQLLKSARSRGLVFLAAAQAMRRLLVDHARQRAALRRGGEARRLPLDDVLADLDERRIDILSLNDELAALEASQPRMHQIVLLRFFSGLEMAEIAEQLGVSIGTVENDWRTARALLLQRMKGE
ncbi:MAG: ECF-type sigma factor [Phycisphaerae bacterium]|nr:ECF-type sigma factor [Phycisphaerae bacterium]